MNDMEHLKQRWSVLEGCENGIRAVGGVGWSIVLGCHGLPNDDGGTKTLQYICDLHNAALDEEQAKPDNNAPPKGYRLATDSERRLYPYPDDCEVMWSLAIPHGAWCPSMRDDGWTVPAEFDFAIPADYQFIDRSDEADAKRLRWFMRHLDTDARRIDAAMAEEVNNETV